MWWTITGNFGNILPIDWSKTYARKMQLPALNLNENKVSEQYNIKFTFIEQLYSNVVVVHLVTAGDSCLCMGHNCTRTLPFVNGLFEITSMLKNVNVTVLCQNTNKVF